MSVIFLSVDDVINMHEEMVNILGGLRELRDVGLLDSAVAYPILLHQFTGTDDLFELAAAYCFHIIKNHAFFDGNKRTGIIVMLQFLEINGVMIKTTNDKIYNLAVAVAASKKSEDDIVTFLKKSAH